MGVVYWEATPEDLAKLNNEEYMFAKTVVGKNGVIGIVTTGSRKGYVMLFPRDKQPEINKEVACLETKFRVSQNTKKEYIFCPKYVYKHDIPKAIEELNRILKNKKLYEYVLHFPAKYTEVVKALLQKGIIVKGNYILIYSGKVPIVDVNEQVYVAIIDLNEGSFYEYGVPADYDNMKVSAPAGYYVAFVPFADLENIINEINDESTRIYNSNIISSIVVTKNSKLYNLLKKAREIDLPMEHWVKVVKRAVDLAIRG